MLECDNSLPQLFTNDDALQAMRSAHRAQRPEGVPVISVRDYATIERRSPDVRPYQLGRQVRQTRSVTLKVAVC